MNLRQNKHASLILALLDEAKNQNTKLIRTVVVKFLYLLDVYTAEDNNGGNTLTGFSWQFLHFGPYASEAVKMLDSLVRNNYVREEKNEDKNYYLYTLSDWNRVENLEKNGVGRYARLRIQTDIRKYAYDLSGLLDKVYFHTAPMESAKPSQLLDFSACKKQNPQDYKHVEMRPLSKKAIKKTREKLRALIAGAKENPVPAMEGTYDEIFIKSMQELEGFPLKPGLKGKAEIKLG